MQYVVMDMEWNQPLSFESHIFKAVGDKLLFEVIQIGAVKLNDSFEIVDTISLPVKPTHYVKIHPRIRRMTGLEAGILDDAPYFCEAVEQFAAWCGEDYVLLTWGCDDVSVLQQNIDFFECGTPLPALYDIQVLFSDVFSYGKDRKGLSFAMEQLGIEQEAEKEFHNAQHDAYYTALVFQKLPDRQNVLKYKETPKKLIHMERRDKKMRNRKKYPSLKAAFESSEAKSALCPVCKQKTVQDGRYIRQAGDKYAGLLTCETHGAVFCQLLFAAGEDGSVMMAVTTAPANRTKVAYIHTKQLKPPPHDDPMEALLKAGRTNMPFED